MSGEKIRTITSAKGITSPSKVNRGTANSKTTACMPEVSHGTVKLKPTATKYCSCYNGNYNVFVTPMKYFDMEWENVGRVPNVSYYNVKLRSNGIVILVSENDIIEI